MAAATPRFGDGSTRRFVHRVLVAEDDASLRRIVVARLLDDGHEVFEVSSGDEVLHLVQRIARDAFPTDALDLVLMDNKMPGLTGIEVLQRLRALHSSMPIILMTAFPDPWVEKQTRRLGARLLPKPFSLRALSDCATGVLLAGTSLHGRGPP